MVVTRSFGDAWYFAAIAARYFDSPARYFGSARSDAWISAVRYFVRAGYMHFCVVTWKVGDAEYCVALRYFMWCSRFDALALKRTYNSLVAVVRWCGIIGAVTQYFSALWYFGALWYGTLCDALRSMP